VEETNYLTLEEVLAIHFDQINRYGGSHGVRELNLLIAAISRPQATFGGFDLYSDVFSKASALLQSLVMNHPFVDGNKRTAIVSTARLLAINGYELKMARKDLINITLEVESKKKSIEGVASWLKKHSKKIS
jgi:death-on-curing family protein